MLPTFANISSFYPSIIGNIKLKFSFNNTPKGSNSIEAPEDICLKIQFTKFSTRLLSSEIEFLNSPNSSIKQVQNLQRTLSSDPYGYPLKFRICVKSFRYSNLSVRELCFLRSLNPKSAIMSFIDIKLLLA